jgi:hypothetical protein
VEHALVRVVTVISINNAAQAALEKKSHGQQGSLDLALRNTARVDPAFVDRSSRVLSLT